MWGSIRKRSGYVRGCRSVDGNRNRSGRCQGVVLTHFNQFVWGFVCDKKICWGTFVWQANSSG
ncbi:hypothetical protein PM082_024459 [Marasmius tenuissimus]|nr:hypothetical protein PM082_024459 [Marasmius tenuissimus]